MHKLFIYTIQNVHEREPCERKAAPHRAYPSRSRSGAATEPENTIAPQAVTPAQQPEAAQGHLLLVIGAAAVLLFVVLLEYFSMKAILD